MKKTNYDANITETENKFTDHDHDEYITTAKFNNLAAKVFDARFKKQTQQQKQILMTN